MPKSVGPILAAVFTGVQVGAALVASRYVIEQTTPSTLAMLRYSIGFLCLLPVALMMTRQRFKAADILPICILGIFQFGILVALLNYALQYMSSARVALIFATFPLQTMILAALFGKETLSWSKSLGVLLTVVGVAVTLGEDLNHANTNTNEILAAAAVGLSAFIGSVCSILYRPYLERYPPQNISALAMLASVGALFLLSNLEGGLSTITTVTMSGWLAIFFVGISSGVGYFAWLWALKNMSPTRVTMFLALGPITSAALGSLFLSETITWFLITGMILVIAGLILGLSRSSPSSATTDRV